jgi:hypothetical protein
LSERSETKRTKEPRETLRRPSHCSLSERNETKRVTRLSISVEVWWSDAQYGAAGWFRWGG